MAFEQLTYTKSWKNAEDFPTYEPDETKVRADLQLLYDEAKDAFNRLVGELNASTAAENLPIAAVEGMKAQSVQAAIEEVFASVIDAASGNIIDGTVTREKLDAALLKRVYGGRVWISQDAPTPEERPETDFPLGQLWLQPRCTVKNCAAENWEIRGGTAEEKGDGWVFTTDGVQDYLTVSQELENIGTAGQKILVHLQQGQEDDQLNQLALYLNGVELEPEEDGWYETEADQTGGLEIQLHGEWPDAQVDRKIEVTTLVVVNVDALEAECGACSDWAGRLAPFGSFREAELPMQLWLQTAAGNWEQMFCQVQPVSGGGTGLSQVEQGALLYGSGGETLARLPAADRGILQWSGVIPQLLTPETFARHNQFPYILTGQYIGNGGVVDGKAQEEFSVELEIPDEDAASVKFLLIYAEDGSCDTAVVANGGRHSAKYPVIGSGAVTYEAWVSLQGRTLTFANKLWGNDKDNTPNCHLNAGDVTYSWIAVCGGVPVSAEGGEQAA